MTLENYHLDSAPSVVLIQCVEIKHSLWPQPLRYVLNDGDGVTVQHEDGVTAFYEYMPLNIQRGASSDNLDQKLTITVADLGEIVPQLLKTVRAAKTQECPEVIYRQYMSTDLNNPIDVVSQLYVSKSNRDEQGTTFEAGSPSLNVVGTGERYTVEMFPSLRSFM